MAKAVNYYLKIPGQLDILILEKFERLRRSAPMLKSLLNRVKPEDMTYRLVSIIPGNLRALSLYVIEHIGKPEVMLDGELVKDHTERGPLRRKRIAEAVDFEVRDGVHPVMGFHGGPTLMWVSDRYVEIAQHCEKKGWLKFK